MRLVSVIDRFGDIVPLGDTYNTRMYRVRTPARVRAWTREDDHLSPSEISLRLARTTAPAIAPKEIGDLEICTAGIIFPSR